MKHRGVKIIQKKYPIGIKCNDRTFKTETIFGIGWCPIGVDYPMSKEEAKESVDRLIEQVMEKVGVNEREAVKLLNE